MECGFSIISYYSQSPDWVKAVWVLSAPAFTLGMTAVILWYRVAMRRLDRSAVSSTLDSVS